MSKKKRTINEDGETEIEQENIIVQLRKVINLNGKKVLTFNSGTQTHTTVAVATMLLNKYQQLKTTAEKDALSKALAKSDFSFYATATKIFEEQMLMRKRNDDDDASNTNDVRSMGEAA